MGPDHGEGPTEEKCPGPGVGPHVQMVAGVVGEYECEHFDQ